MFLERHLKRPKHRGVDPDSLCVSLISRDSTHFEFESARASLFYDAGVVKYRRAASLNNDAASLYNDWTLPDISGFLDDTKYKYKYSVSVFLFVFDTNTNTDTVFVGIY